MGQYEKFYCSSDLDPQTVTWYRNGTVIASVSGSYKDIIIDPISTDHHGMMYSCAVVSPYGSQQRNKTLRVTGWDMVQMTLHTVKLKNTIPVDGSLIDMV